MHSLLQAVEREPQPESVEKAWAQGIAFYFHVRMVRFLLKRPDLYIGSSFKVSWPGFSIHCCGRGVCHIYIFVSALLQVRARLQHPLVRQRRKLHVDSRVMRITEHVCKHGWIENHEVRAVCRVQRHHLECFQLELA